jgi:excinuclease ABC subunit C
MSANELIRSKLRKLPHKPGVYLMKDRFGTVIYVGKARDLRRRISQYFHPSRRHSWDLKLQALVEAISDFDIHQVSSEAEALLLEGKLIKEFKPRYNISFKDDKRFLLIKVNLNDPIPNFVITRLKKEDQARYFGPFVDSVAARRTLDIAKKQFLLRGCKAFTPDETDYKHCLYRHLKYCTAPCIGNVTLQEYKLQVEAACEFMDGQIESIREQLKHEMEAASRAMNYEKAAQLRDAIASLEVSTQKQRAFERIPYSLPLAIHPQEDMEQLGRILGLPAPPLRIEGYDISNISGSFSVASLVSFYRGKPDSSSYRRFRIKGVFQQDDFACMAEVIKRRYTRLKKEIDLKKQNILLPDLIVVDGGLGQVNAAYSVLKELNLEKIPIIGLAKKLEEIYRPGNFTPLVLDHSLGALKLLQRIRDESHRFANNYNAQLRLRKIQESILDEFPGIGERRKRALLKRFGSVHRLRRASVEEIAKVPYFGLQMAVRLVEFLKARSEPSTTKTGESDS